MPQSSLVSSLNTRPYLWWGGGWFVGGGWPGRKSSGWGLMMLVQPSTVVVKSPVQTPNVRQLHGRLAIASSGDGSILSPLGARVVRMGSRRRRRSIRPCRRDGRAVRTRLPDASARVFGLGPGHKNSGVIAIPISIPDPGPGIGLTPSHPALLAVL